MKNVIRKILYAGLRTDMSLQLSRTIILTNAIAFILITLATILLTYFQIEHVGPWRLGMKVTLVTIIILFLILVSNRFYFTNISRALLSVLVPVMTGLNILVPRINNASLYHYIYVARTSGMFCLVMVTTIVPLMVFSTKEWKYMVPTLALNLSILLLLDPILYTYSAEYVPGEFGVAKFLANNMLLITAEFFIIGATIFLKSLFETFEKENEILLASQHEKNAELRKRNLDIEAQNHEIQAQSEELIQSQEQLVSAHNEIERQKGELEVKNVQLEQSLDSKSKDLLHTNQQLINQNQELQQFSYTVSHNLRGPVASMLGLINIHHLSKDDAEQKVIFSLLEKSTHALETVIHDLNKIIDIRRDKFNVTEEVSLRSEIDLIILSLKVFITGNDVTINLDLQEDKVLSIKAYVNSILYNLISNAIQYRSPERKPVIQVSSYRKGDTVVIKVSDNGLGIDLGRFKVDLFKLYKRFHTHVEGKGLGLYIVKQQVEKLNGAIEVFSEPNQGASFVVSIREGNSGL